MIKGKQIQAASLIVAIMLLFSVSGCKTRAVNVQPGNTVDIMAVVAAQLDRGINLVGAAEDTLTSIGREKLISPQAELRGHETIIKLARGFKSAAGRAKSFVGRGSPLDRANLALLLGELSGFVGDLNATGALGIRGAEAQAQWNAALSAIEQVIKSIEGLLGS